MLYCRKVPVGMAEPVLLVTDIPLQLVQVDGYRIGLLEHRRDGIWHRTDAFQKTSSLSQFREFSLRIARAGKTVCLVGREKLLQFFVEPSFRDGDFFHN